MVDWPTQMTVLGPATCGTRDVASWLGLELGHAGEDRAVKYYGCFGYPLPH